MTPTPVVDSQKQRQSISQSISVFIVGCPGYLCNTFNKSRCLTLCVRQVEKKRMECGLYRPGSRGAHTRTSLHAAATGLPQSVRRQESDHTSTCCPMMMLLRLLVFCVLACSVLAVSDVDDEAQSSLVSRLLGGQPRRGEFRGRGRGRRPRPTPRPRPVVPDVRTASVVDICRWRI